MCLTLGMVREIYLCWSFRGWSIGCIGWGTRGLKDINPRLPSPSSTPCWRDRKPSLPITQGHLLKGCWEKPKKAHGLNPRTLHHLVSFTMASPLWTYTTSNIAEACVCVCACQSTYFTNPQMWYFKEDFTCVLSKPF